MKKKKKKKKKKKMAKLPKKKKKFELIIEIEMSQPQVKRFYFCRHGETDFNTAGRLQGINIIFFSLIHFFKFF